MVFLRNGIEWHIQELFRAAVVSVFVEDSCDYCLKQTLYMGKLVREESRVNKKHEEISLKVSM
jgi:hypothetical protein